MIRSMWVRGVEVIIFVIVILYTCTLIMASEEEKSNIHIGIIGFGDMGRLYANTFAKAGWKK
jgi:hypothetical protein